ncbi:MAG TPA: hypothetical protein VM580_34820 [Labilithrix sp.]|nr:hypothetical protein [Labilithrix sp.]
MKPHARLAIRWTIGHVSLEGFEALRLSVWGSYRAFGDDVDRIICVNTVPLALAVARTGQLPPNCTWRDTTGEIPGSLAPYLGQGMAEGAGWKLAPLRIFPDCHELALDNDCILWQMPRAVARWLQDDHACLLAEDVRPSFGQFARICGDAPRNAGMRGLPPGFDLERAMLELLESGASLVSELDEQGLQVAATTRDRVCHVVAVDDVTICSPFPPHLPQLGRCGAHFCGLNARDLGWQLDGRPASEFVREHWHKHRPELYARVGISPPSDFRRTA